MSIVSENWPIYAINKCEHLQYACYSQLENTNGQCWIHYGKILFDLDVVLGVCFNGVIHLWFFSNIATGCMQYYVCLYMGF